MKPRHILWTGGGLLVAVVLVVWLAPEVFLFLDKHPWIVTGLAAFVTALALTPVGASPYVDADPSPRLGRYSMRVRSALLALAFALTASTAVQAQEEVTLGDKVRVSTEGDGTWTEGQLTGVENDTLSIAKGVEELHYRLGEVQGAERWEARNPALLLLTGTVGGAVGFWLPGKLDGGEEGGVSCVPGGSCRTIPGESPWITGSEAGDLGVGAGIGLVGGLVLWAVDPGDWKEWEIPAP